MSSDREGPEDPISTEEELLVEEDVEPTAPLGVTPSMAGLLSDLDADLANAASTGKPIAPPRAPAPGMPRAAVPGKSIPPKPLGRKSIPPPAPRPSPPSSSPGSVSVPPPPRRSGTPISRPPPRAPSSSARPIARASLPSPAQPNALQPAAPGDAANAKTAIEAWERELSGTEDPARRSRIHYEIARLAEQELEDPRKAATHYQEVLSIHPDHLPALRGARRVLIARKNYQAALPLFDAEARVTKDPHQKAAVHLAKGRLLEDVLGQKVDARREYMIAAELDRGTASILKALEQSDLESGAHAELSRTYERMANVVSSDPRHRAALIVQRARVIETREKSIEHAIELYETALKLDPEVAGALDALKRLLHTHRRWRDLIAVLHREAEQSTDAGVRTMAFYRIARLHADRLGSEEEALVALERAMAESPDEPLVLEELARLYERGEKWSALVTVLSRLSEVADEIGGRVQLLSRIGQVREERLDDAHGALAAYEAALALSPTHVPTLHALGKLYAKSGDWENLVRMYAGEAEHAEDAKRRAAAHARIGEVLELRLSDGEGAIEHHGRALSLQPGYPPSFKALSRLFAEAGKWRELIELYTRAVDEASDKDKAISYLLKIGAVYEDSLGEAAQAAHAYRRVLELDPKHLGALHALQRSTERAGRWAELVEALEREAELVRDPAQIAPLLHRSGEVLDELLGDRDAALVRFRKVLAIDGSYAPAISSLGRVYHRMGRWDDLLELFGRELALAPKGPSAVSLLMKMGELAEEKIGRDDEALGFYRKATELDPTNRAALRAYARKLRERGNWSELVQALSAELAGSSERGARARIAYRLGEVYEERLNQADKAIAAYEQSRDADPSYRPALDGLARLRADQGAFRKLVDELEREAAASRDPKLAIAALMRAGELWIDQLNEPRRALGVYEKILEREPGHLAALLAMEAIHRRLSSFEGLARVYASLSRTLSDPQARVASLLELARVQETRLSAPLEDVRATYEVVLSLSPGDATALAGLERIALAANSAPLLAEVDRRMIARTEDPIAESAYRTRLAGSLARTSDPRALDEYRAALAADPENVAAARGMSRLAREGDNPEAVAEAARREARVTTDPVRAAKLLVEAGRVTESQLADPATAIADFERALEISPDDPDAATHLVEALLATNHGDRATDRLARAAQSSKSQERAAQLWLEVARLQADLLSNVAGAIASLQRVHKVMPNHLPTIRRLAQLYERDHQWSEAAQLLGRVVQLAPDREALKEAHLGLAALWDGHLGDPSRALLSLQAVLAIDPKHREALRRLIALQERQGELDKAADVATRLIESSGAETERAEAMVLLAAVDLRRGRPDLAQSTLVRAVVLEGPGGAAARALRESIRDREGYALYTDALKQHVANWNGKPPVPRQAWVELAGILGDSLGQHEESAEVLRAAIRALPDDVELDRQLAARLLRMGQSSQAVALLRRRIAENVTRVECWRDLRSALSVSPDPAARDVASLTLAPLALLGAANEQELAALQTRASLSARPHAGTLTDETLASMYDFGREQALLPVLSALPEAFSRIYPPDFEAFGLSARDRISSRSGHPMRALSDRVAAVFGIEQHELYLHRGRTRTITVELTEPLSVLVPVALSELSEAGQFFLLARVFANAAMKLSVVDKLTPREIEVLVAAAVRPLARGFGEGLTSEDTLDDQARRIQKALSRRARRALEEATPRYVDAPPVDFAGWARNVSWGASRAALLASDDLIAAVDALRKTERDLGSIEPRDLLRGAPLVADMVRFWASEPSIAIRRRAGTLS